MICWPVVLMMAISAHSCWSSSLISFSQSRDCCLLVVAFALWMFLPRLNHLRSLSVDTFQHSRCFWKWNWDSWPFRVLTLWALFQKMGICFLFLFALLQKRSRFHPLVFFAPVWTLPFSATGSIAFYGLREGSPRLTCKLESPGFNRTRPLPLRLINVWEGTFKLKTGR